MPKLPCTHGDTIPSAQMNLFDHLARGPLVATRPVYAIALLGPCAAYIQGGLTKLLDFCAAVAETQSFGLPFATAATGATTGYVRQATMPLDLPACLLLGSSKGRALPAIKLGSPEFIIHLSLVRQRRASGL